MGLIAMSQTQLPADELLDVVALRRENQQLREALVSRATIDQAKGILMTAHGGTPEQAFARLVVMSQNTNVPLKDVARAIVYQASAGSGG